ncbi:uncharacterized protein [Physcomitrium patens]|uniref:Heterokaryon incompatibility domain-containing protein n=2 Tax=Physcomitrium patens TaxID=3218 RepID=A0A7I4AKQ5_PHYPA|nr:uncharacterized protein LOC112290156 isoform X2 [Physcomitrium patens]|eukprot:XP_024391922.1 uncharacterized protein LOC112290156 isoform X2 [Physcomitrella patens]
MATQGHDREQASFPLRVICIKETFESDGGICFDVPESWGFHIISHTWTEDARNWSVAIANTMAEKKVTCDKNAYAELFKQVSFAKKRGYTDLLEFLSILALDGVQRVWFDALCINQKSGDEKNREIARMGEYYARCAGCYVWCHGMGGGFRLWAQADPPRYYTLPRWFSRVWTLQEFVLPNKLVFVVGMDMEGCTAMFAHKAYCRSSGLSWQPAELMDTLVETKFVSRYESLRQVNSRELFPCPHCRHQQKGHVYFVEREKYFELMDRSSHKSIEAGRLPPTFWTEFKSPLYRLRTILSCNEELRSLQRAALVVREISMRDCAEQHDEDRLLSILGLLQVEGKVQLRTGRGLEEQIFDVARSLLNSSPSHEHQQLLLLLCFAQYHGSPVTSMSWAPTFSRQKLLGDMRLQSFPMFHNFTSIAQVGGLGKPGLVLRCPFLRAKAVPFAEHRQNCSTCLQCRQAGRNHLMNHFILEIQNRPHYSVLLWAVSDEDHEAMEEPGAYDTPEAQSEVSTSEGEEKEEEEEEEGPFNNEELEDFQSSQAIPWKDEFPAILPDNEEFDSDDEADDNKEGDTEEEEEEQEEDEEDEEDGKGDEIVDAVYANISSWEQDVLCMDRDRFIVGGFGAIVPLNVLTSDKVNEGFLVAS